MRSVSFSMGLHWCACAPAAGPEQLAGVRQAAADDDDEAQVEVAVATNAAAYAAEGRL